MNRTEFTIATAVVLFIAFALGWLAYAAMHRFRRIKGSDMSEIDLLAQSLHSTEEALNHAVQGANLREAELLSLNSQSAAELRAAMNALRDVRAENEEMRSYIEKMHANN